jgi:hypothetical protein
MTREDLIKGLRGCLSATEKFGEYAYPLILEKLTSDIQSAKLDCLQTLVSVYTVYMLDRGCTLQWRNYVLFLYTGFSGGITYFEKFYVTNNLDIIV